MEPRGTDCVHSIHDRKETVDGESQEKISIAVVQGKGLARSAHPSVPRNHAPTNQRPDLFQHERTWKATHTSQAPPPEQPSTQSSHQLRKIDRTCSVLRRSNRSGKKTPQPSTETPSNQHPPPPPSPYHPPSPPPSPYHPPSPPPSPYHPPSPPQCLGFRKSSAVEWKELGRLG